MTLNPAYDTLNTRVLAAVPARARMVLDVGCGTGRLGRSIKERQRCQVTGITHSADEAQQAREWLDTVRETDLERFEPVAGQRFDAIVLSHVLEHIRDPERLLKRILREALPGATVIVAVPNVLWWRQRMEFVRGRFRYADSGIMDRTHVHFFDLETAKKLMLDCGMTLETIDVAGGWPGSRFFGPFQKVLDRSAVALSPGLFGGEFIFVCSLGAKDQDPGSG